MMADELVHVIKNLVLQEVREIRPFVYAHVASYDNVAHAVKVVVPSMRDDMTNEPLVSGWLNMPTHQSGSGTGVQIAPVGGASIQDPTAGEQALVALNDRGTGVASVIALYFNNKFEAPSPKLASPLLPGEMVAYSNGVLVRWHQNGDLEIATTGKVNITTQGDTNITAAQTMVNISSKGDTNITSQGVMNIGSSQDNTSVYGDTELDLISPTTVKIGTSTAGVRVARDGDPVFAGTNLVGIIRATSTTVFST
jgi:phage baseplate assembly protein gpV